MAPTRPSVARRTSEFSSPMGVMMKQRFGPTFSTFVVAIFLSYFNRQSAILRRRRQPALDWFAQTDPYELISSWGREPHERAVEDYKNARTKFFDMVPDKAPQDNNGNPDVSAALTNERESW